MRHFILFCFIVSSICIDAQKNFLVNKIVAHTDSSIYILNAVKKNKKWDLYIKRKTIGSDTSVFETCLNLNKLYDGNFKPFEFRHQIYQCKNNIVLVFFSDLGNSKIAIGKLISYNGNVSEAFIIDKTENINNNIIKSFYYTMLTSRNEILLTAKRTFSSGFQRDKCILLDENLQKIWEYDFPKINTKTQTNIISDVDFNQNLIFFLADFDKDIFNERSSNMDSLMKIKLGFSKYDIKIRKDSIEIFFASPSKKTIYSKKIYYPFGPLPHLKGLSQGSVLLYNVVDIDDEKYIFPSKKGYYLKRLDLRNNTTTLDTIIILPNENQNALTYIFEGQTNRTTNKQFFLIYEKTLDNNLYSIYEHGFGDVKLELIISKYNIIENKIEWIKFIPKKTDVMPENMNTLTISYFNKSLNITYFEHMNNLGKKYDFNSYEKSLRYKKSNYIYHTINENGLEIKNCIKMNDENYLFPWLKFKAYKTETYNFFGRYYFDDSIFNRN